MTLSPAAYRRITLAADVALGFIIVTGAGVRLTGSGLGCPDWPTCAEGRVVAPLEYHAMVEFVNRTVTGLVSIAVIVAVLGSLIRRPYRRDLVFLSLGLVGGVLAQIVLGGLVVLFHLYPPLVMGHMVVSMALLANAVVLHHRASDPPEHPSVGPSEARLGRALVVAVAVAMSFGTVVTGAGPHAGSHDGELVDRLPWAVASVARFHTGAVFVTVALALILLDRLRKAGVGGEVASRARWLVAALVLQGTLGYVQYFTGVPPILVGLHVAGAAAIWVVVLRLQLAMRPAPVAADRELVTA